MPTVCTGGNQVRNKAAAAGRLVVAFLVAMLLGGCAHATPTACPTGGRLDLTQVDPTDAALLFQYPLDLVEEHPHDADFGEYRTAQGGMFHAAEDYWRPAGTAVLAIADGEVSYSGTMGGYGWLVIVDHPEMNIYSLYGHLSPSRWRADLGPVAKGDLVGYLGDEWENGGSRERPLVTHLHLGIRTGQRDDYPGKGEWRWMAGWINLCPADLGWLQPSAVVAAQLSPAATSTGPAGGLIERWSTEILLILPPLLGAVFWIAAGIRRRKPVWLVAVAVVLVAVAWFMAARSFSLLAPLAAVSAASLLAAIWLQIARASPTNRA